MDPFHLCPPPHPSGNVDSTLENSPRTAAPHSHIVCSASGAAQLHHELATKLQSEILRRFSHFVSFFIAMNYFRFISLRFV